MDQSRFFPKIAARTLSGREISFPDEASGKLSLIAVAFVRGAQSQLDSWTEPFERACSEDGVYEIPMIQGKVWSVLSGFIDGGMRSGIPEWKHDSVATYYGDTSSFRKEMGIEDMSKGYVFLLDHEGNIIYRGSGTADEEGIKQMLEAAGNSCDP
ncbi:MAG: hypothetical protein QCI82_02970 [Candidatus Thermoplasmatota archaeon]|nr:hypothetical protein [Candidatus Thermoplasmatota archaeon]